jgi:hypothetical protein
MTEGCHARFDILAAVLLMIQVFLDITLCRLVIFTDVSNEHKTWPFRDKQSLLFNPEAEDTMLFQNVASHYRALESSESMLCQYRVIHCNERRGVKT